MASGSPLAQWPRCGWSIRSKWTPQHLIFAPNSFIAALSEGYHCGFVQMVGKSDWRVIEKRYSAHGSFGSGVAKEYSNNGA